jgi:undecaprenyl diphosphate synthase
MSQTADSNVPTHLGIILDGNRRWAKQHGLTVAEGLKEGQLNFRNITRAALRRGVKYLSAYVFSTENWKRDKTEVQSVLRLLTWVLKHEVKELHKDGIRVRVIGSKMKFGAAMVRAILQAEELTKDNDRGTLLFCLDYGGQQEIVQAVKRIAASGIDPEEITPDLITHHLDAPDVPPLDLIIRTSGEQRLSNFMLWEAAYSELYFTKTYWPDFSEQDLDLAFDDYAKRQRRFGA